MKHFRVRMRVLSLPACPDWRNTRIRNKVKDDFPTEWELEQMALDKLKYKRQQSLAQLQGECFRLKQRLAEENMAELAISTIATTALLDVNGCYENGWKPSPVFRRSTRSQSLSGVNLASASLNSTSILKPASRTMRQMSNDETISVKRRKRLEELRKEMEDFAIVHKTRNDVNGNIVSSASMPNFRGSDLSLVSQDGIEHAKDIPEIGFKIQKRREHELERARREIHLLKTKLKTGILVEEQE